MIPEECKKNNERVGEFEFLTVQYRSERFDYAMMAILNKHGRHIRRQSKKVTKISARLQQLWKKMCEHWLTHKLEESSDPALTETVFWEQMNHVWRSREADIQRDIDAMIVEEIHDRNMLLGLVDLDAASPLDLPGFWTGLVFEQLTVELPRMLRGLIVPGHQLQLYESLILLTAHLQRTNVSASQSSSVNYNTATHNGDFDYGSTDNPLAQQNNDDAPGSDTVLSHEANLDYGDSPASTGDDEKGY